MTRHFNNVMELYIIENYKERYPELNGRELTDELIKDCFEEYGLQRPQVLRSAKGKPYVEGKVHVSVSHSGKYFVCIISDVPVGIDIQEYRNARFDKIADRYFTEAEKAYIDETGESGFFSIWTRKEAYSKLTGEGIAELIKGTDVIDRKDVIFSDIQIEEGVWCAYCVWA